MAEKNESRNGAPTIPIENIQVEVSASMSPNVMSNIFLLDPFILMVWLFATWSATYPWMKYKQNISTIANDITALLGSSMCVWPEVVSLVAPDDTAACEADASAADA